MKAEKLLFYSLISMFLFSCEGNTHNPSDIIGKEIHLNATIKGANPRASGSTWDKGDAIGIYMKKSGEGLSSSAIAKNVNYQTTGTSEFSPAKGAPTITLPLDGSNVDFISYYPYKKTIENFNYPIDLSNQSVQANIDLLYADNAKTINKTKPYINLSFSHQLSKIVLKIEHQLMPNLRGIEVIITNAATKANFNLKNGKLSSSSAISNIACTVSNDGQTAEAILLPTTNLNDMEFWFILDEETFNYPLRNVSEIQSFEKSTRYTYNIFLKSDLIPPISEGGISNWTESPSGNAIVNTTDKTPPRIPGSKRLPYTVTQAQEYQGKNDVWVEGFIVGYFSSNTINSFSTDLSGNVSQSNLGLAEDQREKEVTNIIPVMLGNGTVRNDLNLRDNPFNFNKKVKIKGDLDTYFTVPGLRDIKAYAFTSP